MNLEEHNLNEIEGLSQRGQTLSIVDLIKANTLNIDMASYAMYAISNGASFLTAARPGNAGKTTLLACLLTFLPLDVQIITISDPSIITQINENIKNTNKLCALTHEIGSGHWYGYLWGKNVGELFKLMNHECQIASCIHADTLPELRDIMISRELKVSEEDFAKLGLILFMKLEREMLGYKRRVITFYEKDHDSGKHNLLFNWDEKSDRFIDHARLLDNQISYKLEQYKSFIKNLVKLGNTDFRWVRKQIVSFYKSL